MTNFDYLKSEPQFHIFADVAISAERIIHIDPEACIINCRRSMEFAIKWMYSIDQSLVRPYQDNLSSLMHTEEFKDIVDENLWKRLDFIRRMGNNAAHTGKKVTLTRRLCVCRIYLFFLILLHIAMGTSMRSTNMMLLCLTRKSRTKSRRRNGYQKWI